ncbi:hypothetical protein ACS0TY_030146 [Phlomoides rotata]
MATQMSPEEGSIHSSFSSFPALKLDDVRDVQVDDKGTTTATHPTNFPTSYSSKTKTCTSKLKREEAKINAWENLQKAKAEAAIQKLEMKLQKKRSASMDKIANKLRGAQMKAQAMRNQTPTTPHKGMIPYRLHLKMCSLSCCFFCNTD